MQLRPRAAYRWEFIWYLRRARMKNEKLVTDLRPGGGGYWMGTPCRREKRACIFPRCVADKPKKEKKGNGQPKGGMGGRHAATTQGL